MSNLEELAKAVRSPKAVRPVVEYRSPSPPPTPPARQGIFLAPVTLARLIGWGLTAFAAVQALLAAISLLGAIIALASSDSLMRAAGGLNLMVSLAFVGGALGVGALGQIVLLLAELVIQGRQAKR